MGFLDFLFDKEKAAERTLQKHEKKLTNMYVQAGERQYVVQELRDLGTPEAVWVLLQRYKENNPNSTLDIEEKELIYDTLVRMSAQPEADVVHQVKRYVIEKEVKINWPMRILSDILSYDTYIDFIVELLSRLDVEYQRSTEKKQELLLRCTEINHPALAEQIARFVQDDNETIRFLAFDAALHQDATEFIAPSVFAQLVEEDSHRIIQKVLPLLLERKDLKVPENLREQVLALLPEGMGVHKQGYIYRRRR